MTIHPGALAGEDLERAAEVVKPGPLQDLDNVVWRDQYFVPEEIPVRGRADHRRPGFTVTDNVDHAVCHSAEAVPNRVAEVNVPVVVFGGPSGALRFSLYLVPEALDLLFQRNAAEQETYFRNGLWIGLLSIVREQQDAS